MQLVETKPGLRELTLEMVRSKTGEIFKFRRPAGQEGISSRIVELKLVEVTSYASPASADAARFRNPFSLLFELNNDMPQLGAGLHKLEHPEFAEDDWHIARVHVAGRDPAKKYYESVFA